MAEQQAIDIAVHILIDLLEEVGTPSLNGEFKREGKTYILRLEVKDEPTN